MWKTPGSSCSSLLHHRPVFLTLRFRRRIAHSRYLTTRPTAQQAPTRSTVEEPQKSGDLGFRVGAHTRNFLFPPGVQGLTRVLGLRELRGQVAAMGRMENDDVGMGDSDEEAQHLNAYTSGDDDDSEFDEAIPL